MKAPAAIFGRVVDRWREETLGLARRRGRHDPLRGPDGEAVPVLHAFSPSVLPPPADWPDCVHTTGYWFLRPSGAALPRRVEDFLRAGDPPVFVGFGSISGRDPARSTAVVLEAARRAGKRLVIGAGWGGLDSSVAGDDVLAVEDVDYLMLFPRVAAVVHHGGRHDRYGIRLRAPPGGVPVCRRPAVLGRPGAQPRCRSRTTAATPPYGRRSCRRHYHRRHGSGHGTCRRRVRLQGMCRGRSIRGSDRGGKH